MFMIMSLICITTKSMFSINGPLKITECIHLNCLNFSLWSITVAHLTVTITNNGVTSSSIKLRKLKFELKS